MFYFVTPDLENISGGNKYDLNIINYLKSRKIALQNIVIDMHCLNIGSFLKLLRLPHNSTLIIDGLIAYKLLFMMKKLSSRYKVIILIHHPVCYEYDKNGSICEKLKERKIYSAAHKIITVSKTMSLVVKKILNRNIKINIVYPAVDDIYHEKKYLNNNQNYKLISVGSIIPRKNIHNMIETLNLLENKWTLSFIGSFKTDYVYFEKIKKLIQKYSLEQRVTFYGNIYDEQKLIELYNKSKAYICLSNYEGFGMSNLESAIFGLPLIISDLPIFRETLFCHNRYYVNQNDPHDVVKYINKLDKLQNQKSMLGIRWSDSGKKFLKHINE